VQPLLSTATAFFLIAFTGSGLALAGTSNSLMDISTDGQLLACSNRDSGTVTLVDLQQHTVTHEVAVGKHPEGVTFLGNSHQLAVAVYGEDLVLLLNADSGKVVRRVEVFDEPYGVVSSSDGRRLFVTLDYPGKVLEIEAEAWKVAREISAGRFVRGICIDTGNKRLYVTEFYSTKVKAVDIASGEVVDEWAGASTDNLLRQVTLHPSRPKAYIPHIRSRVTAVHGEGSIFPYVSVVDTTLEEGRRRKRIPMDAFRGNLVTCNPWEVAISPDGRSAYVVFSGTDDMFACGVIDDDYRELDYRSYVRVGASPRAVRVSPKGDVVYVYNSLDFTVSAFDTETLRRTHHVRVTGNPLADEVLAGKKLFYSALQPMVGRRWIACSSCHPDGQPDGRTWHNPEGLRNTQSLAAMAWTHPVHWSADRDEVQDFEHTIRGPLMQGRGLIRGSVNDSLSDPNRGLSRELDALAAYSNSHRLTLSPHAKNGLSEAAKRGQRLFLSDTVGCSSCHSGPFYTDSVPRKISDIVRHDVGTGIEDPSEKMGPAYDTPTLHGLYRTAPYLHHGRAATLEGVLTKYNLEDRHGATSGLSRDQLQDLVEFLKSLPFADPGPEADEKGMNKVTQ
jgi:YVTN family beta-propeller protein